MPNDDGLSGKLYSLRKALSDCDIAIRALSYKMHGSVPEGVAQSAAPPTTDTVHSLIDDCAVIAVAIDGELARLHNSVGALPDSPPQPTPAGAPGRLR